jgi:hypothetical protein
MTVKEIKFCVSFLSISLYAPKVKALTKAIAPMAK